MVKIQEESQPQLEKEQFAQDNESQFEESRSFQNSEPSLNSADQEQGQSSENNEAQMQQLQEEQNRIKQQLKSLPYGVILQQRKQLEAKMKSVKGKKAKKKKFGGKVTPEEPRDKNAPKEIPIWKKPKKNTERPVIFGPSRAKTIDPRFQDYAGKYNEDLASKTYDFIPKIQEQQIKVLKKKLEGKQSGNRRSTKKLSESEKQVLQKEYNRITNEKKQNELFQLQKSVKRSLKQREENNVSREKNRSSWGEGKNDQKYREKTKPIIKRKEFRQEFEKAKLRNMSQVDKEKYLKKKNQNVRRRQQAERNNLMYQTNRKNQTN